MADRTPPEDEGSHGGFELPSKLAVTLLVLASGILISVPFLIAALWGQLDGPPGKDRLVGDRQPPIEVVAGPGCPTSTMASYDDIGSFTAGVHGWYRVWADAGSPCDGTFDAVPMSGTSNRADPRTYAQWTFDVSQRFRLGQCRLLVDIPNDDDIRRVGGSPAHYAVFRSPTLSEPAFDREFTIDQIAHRGRWYDAGTFSIVDGRLSVRLSNAGQDWKGNQRTDAHVAAARIHASCRPG